METITFETYPRLVINSETGEENPNYDHETHEFTVSKDWAVRWIREECGMTFEAFTNEYTYDDTIRMYEDALRENVLIEDRTLTTVCFSEIMRKWEWRNGRYEDVEKVLHRYSVTCESEAECFKKIYTGYERPLRYCNGYFIRLHDAEQQERYLEWGKHGITIEMYYGNGTVD